MDDDNYPFDRDHCQVDVGFPVSALSRKDELFDRVHEIAQRRGGREAGSSQPTPEFMGRPGYETFGMAIAFEAGDANVEGFIGTVRRELGSSGVTVAFDPENVMSPDVEDEAPRFGR